eukprot:10756766-Heterocapsa_arctica.AAC.1
MRRGAEDVDFPGGEVREGGKAAIGNSLESLDEAAFVKLGGPVGMPCEGGGASSVEEAVVGGGDGEGFPVFFPF